MLNVEAANITLTVALSLWFFGIHHRLSERFNVSGISLVLILWTAIIVVGMYSRMDSEVLDIPVRIFALNMLIMLVLSVLAAGYGNKLTAIIGLLVAGGGAGYFAFHYDDHLQFQQMFALFLIAFGFILMSTRVISFNEMREDVAKIKAPSLPGIVNATQAAVSSVNTSLRFPARTPRMTFADVIGMEETKRRLLEAGQTVFAGVEPHLSGKAKRRAMRNRQEAPRNGILMFGEPGNGKTMFAEALAGELGYNIVTLTFSDVASKWINESTEGVRQAFEDAMRQAPCVFFIDEIDSFLTDRSKVGFSESETVRTTNTMLTLINDLRQHRVLLIGATNHLDNLDSAGSREGRFDFKIEIPVPDEPARAAILNTALLKANMPFDEEAAARVSRRWEGFSASRIASIGKEAAAFAIRNGSGSVGFKDFQDALRVIQGTQGDRIPEDTPAIADVVLPEDSRRRLSGIAKRMINIDETEEMGGTLPSGMLFYGPPGTGKTLCARALAKETGWSFIATNGQEIMSDSKRLDEIVSRAKLIRPVIVFIDEADDVLADRAGNPWTKSVTNRLLAEMDGATGRVDDIVWVAATNHPDALDGAALRGGRIQEKIAFDLPAEHLVAAWADKWISKSKARFDDGLDGAQIARAMGPVSIADAKAIMQGAVNQMLSDDGDDRVVTLKHVRLAMLDVMV